ncbi:MAG: MFS transporter [Crocinitomicaceae bacterium]|jgi:MFS family permease|nr:MFS transporter [Crocinitomicaceae bacterium]
MKRTFTANFWILCASMFLFTTSFNLILPELNEYISILGGADKKGLIITLFALGSLLARPFSGKLSDHIGRKKVMTIGIIIGTVVCLIYPFQLGVFFFLSLRFIHGIAAGFMPTGATASVTDILPSNKRGRGMGIWGTFISLGIGAGQSMGTPIKQALGIDSMFVIASVIALISGALLVYVQESLVEPQKFKLAHITLKWTDVIEPSVIPSAMVMFLSAICSGVIFVITPEISEYLGINNKGWFFMFYVISTIGVRLFSSSWSDRFGRRKTLVVGMIFLIVSMTFIGFAYNPLTYTLAAIVFGFATGVSSPTLFAWTADLSADHRRGVGAGTMFIALELGIMVGSFSTTLIYDNTFVTVLYCFLFGVSTAVLALLYLLWHLKKRHSAT